MNVEDAEEYTQALGQVMAGGWRQIAWGERQGVPQALGLTTREWVNERLGGYVRLSIEERREAVKELTDDGMTQRQAADVLGVDEKTVRRDRAAGAVPDVDDQAIEPSDAADAAPVPAPPEPPEPSPPPDPAEAERLLQERERQQAIARQVNRLRNLIDGWNTIAHFRTNPLRDEVLEAIGPYDRDLVLKIEEAIRP